MNPINAQDKVLVAVRLLPQPEEIDGRWLDDGERERARAFGSPLRRRQFLASHGLARELAARLTGQSQQGWRWETGLDQRRRLRRDDGMACWVSVSHSEDRIAAAVAGHPVGLDLECGARERDWVTLARRLFPEELAATVRGAGSFRQLWALAEAASKRSGLGLQRRALARFPLVPASPDQADAVSWALPGEGALALAAWPGAQVEVTGVDAPPATWRTA